MYIPEVQLLSGDSFLLGRFAGGADFTFPTSPAPRHDQRQADRGIDKGFSETAAFGRGTNFPHEIASL